MHLTSLFQLVNRSTQEARQIIGKFNVQVLNRLRRMYKVHTFLGTIYLHF